MSSGVNPSGILPPDSAAPSSGSSSASSSLGAPFTCGRRADSPDVVRWLADHSPDSTLHVPGAGAKAGAGGASGSPVVDGASTPLTPNGNHRLHGHAPLPGAASKRMYDAAREAAARERLQLLDADTPVGADGRALSEDELRDLEEESRHIEYSRTLVCNAPKSLLWRHLLNKVRHPQLYTCADNVQILFDGPGVVYRAMDVGPPDRREHVKEKITWDEANESVRADLYETDEAKEGYIENSITTDASGHVCLTLSLDWRFRPNPSLTPAILSKWRDGLRTAIDLGCAQTVRMVEEEARLAAQEKRARSNSGAAPREHDAAHAHLQTGGHNGAQRATTPQPADKNAPQMRQIQVATKGDGASH